MVLIYSVIAVFIAWIWVDYYRLIDLFQRNKLWLFVVTFLLGCTSVLLVYFFNAIAFDYIPLELNNNFVNDLLYCTIKIGVVEELAKLLPFVLVYKLFKKEFTEPVDVLVFICTSALGFSAVENVLYFYSHGAEIINGRAILASVGHMLDSAIVAYGYILYRYKEKRNKAYYIPLFFFLGALMHGVYDFWLMYRPIGNLGFYFTLFSFFIGLSLFAVILNNALNNSKYFSYAKVVNNNMVARRLLFYYAMVFLLQFSLLTISNGLTFAVGNLSAQLFITGIIVVVTCTRLSRFKLVKGQWAPLKLELPFEIGEGSGSRFFGLQIKGNSVDETFMASQYQKFVILKPLSSNRAKFFNQARMAFIEEKHFLNGGQSHYLCKLYTADQNGPYQEVLLKQKVVGTTSKDGYPIVAVLVRKRNNPSKFAFAQWAVISPMNPWEV